MARVATHTGWGSLVGRLLRRGTGRRGLDQFIRDRWPRPGEGLEGAALGFVVRYENVFVPPAYTD